MKDATEFHVKKRLKVGTYVALTTPPTQFKFHGLLDYLKLTL